MAELDSLMKQLRDEAAVRGTAWLQDLIAAALRSGEPEVLGRSSGARTQRSRPPERFSPDQRLSGQRQPGTPTGPAAGPPPKRMAREEGGRASGAVVWQGGRMDGTGAAVRPCRSGRVRSASPAPWRSEPAMRGRTRAASPWPSDSTAGVHSRIERGRPGRASHGPGGSTEVIHTGLGKAKSKSAGGGDARRRGRRASATLVARPGGPSSEEEGDRGCDGAARWSGSEEESAPPHRRAAAVEIQSSADEATPVQPGELNVLLSDSSQVSVGGTGDTGLSPVSRGAVAVESGGASGLGGFLAGIKELLQRFEGMGTAPPGPVSSWVPTAGGPGAIVITGVTTGGTAVPAAVTSPSPVVLGSGVAQGTEKTAEATSRQDITRLADAARCEVYVCYEGPLGLHLKQEVRDKLWKGEYFDIFSLLPLEKFNLDRVKPDDSKKEDEEKRRYRLIPRTFTNWLQAFAIMASVIGEKQREHCSALFCYQDAIGEAYRVYGGTAWLRYDEQFRQRRAIRPALRWDHKDISLWMRLMTTARAPKQFFPGGTGGPSTQGHTVGNKKGVCWQYNTGTCRFGASCKYKHECSGCGGSHPGSRCFKQGKGRQGEAANKREDPGESEKDAVVSR